MFYLTQMVQVKCLIQLLLLEYTHNVVITTDEYNLLDIPYWWHIRGQTNMQLQMQVLNIQVLSTTVSSKMMAVLTTAGRDFTAAVSSSITERIPIFTPLQHLYPECASKKETSLNLSEVQNYINTSYS